MVRIESFFFPLKFFFLGTCTKRRILISENQEKQNNIKTKAEGQKIEKQKTLSSDALGSGAKEMFFSSAPLHQKRCFVIRELINDF